LIAYGTAVTDEVMYERFALAGITSIAEADSAVMVRRGMSVQRAYNELLAEAAADSDLEAVVLPHQDLRIEEPSFNQRLRAALEDPSVALIGAVGGRGVRSLGWDDDAEMMGTMGGWVHGEVTYFRSDGFDGVVDVDVLDGTLLIFSPWAARNLRFDLRFERDFHAYDADICFQALALGKRVVVADLWSVHCGFGTIAPRRGSWVRASLELDRKWRPRWPARCKRSDSARSMVTRERLSIHELIEHEVRAARGRAGRAGGAGSLERIGRASGRIVRLDLDCPALSAPDDIKPQLVDVAERTGPWTAHNIELAPGVFTRGPHQSGDERRLRLITQLAADITGRPLESLRVLDLGALEGSVGIEFALHGAEVVLLEGREHNAEKIRFAIDTLGIQRASVRTEDARILSRDVHGEFDVVLCLGLLYHLDEPGVFGLLRAMNEVCNGVLVVDTRVALEDRELERHRREELSGDPSVLGTMREVKVDGRTYRGRDYPEHPPGASPDERRTNSWASLDNLSSLWLTGPSLVNALLDSGFTTVLEPVGPFLPKEPDRRLVVAVAGDEIALRSTSLLSDADRPPLPDDADVERETAEHSAARARIAEIERELLSIRRTRAWRAITRWWRLKRRLTGHW
jgi:hypothetical protein